MATWIIAAVMLLASIGFFFPLWATERSSAGLLNLMVWTGDPAVTNNEIAERMLREKMNNNELAPAEERLSDREMQNLEDAVIDGLYPPGISFQWYQPLTAAFVHGGIVQLLGNLLFFVVFGMRVNEMVGASSSC